MPSMMVAIEQKNSNVGDEVQCKRGVLKYPIEHGDNSSGVCLAGCASDDALHAVVPSIVGGYNKPGQRHHFFPVSLPALCVRLLAECDWNLF